MPRKLVDNICIIPARGGSKAIPHKNIANLGGQPLVTHSIKAARAARSIDRIVVSTDDPIIGKISESVGAEVVWRPGCLSGDTATSEAALIYTLEYLEINEGYDPQLLIFLQCTSPLTLPEDIDGTVRALIDSGADCAFTATEFHHFLWKFTTVSNAEGINHDKSIRPSRQVAPEQYLETGAVYAMRAREFRQAGHRFFGNTAMYITPRERCLEIDEPIDLNIAEALFQNRARSNWKHFLPKSIEAIVMDFDGVMTDNRVLVFEDGREAVFCNRGDGLGLEMLRRHSIPIAVLSSEANPVVTSRCRKLGIEVMQGIENKSIVLKDWAEKKGLSLSNIIYVGNDTNDIDCMKLVGCPIAVADASKNVQSICNLVLTTPGGHLAVRELAEILEEHIQGC